LSICKDGKLHTISFERQTEYHKNIHAKLGPGPLQFYAYCYVLMQLNMAKGFLFVKIKDELE